ncbi:MAG: hypothetical protein ACI9XO_004299 [Paraglaciecola sp.]|jgi:hypothetical protein
MRAIKDIVGKQVKDLITKFFYKNNHLCFQILLHTRMNETIAYGVYVNYSEYKKDFDNLQNARSNNLKITIQNKNKEKEIRTAKVA